MSRIVIELGDAERQRGSCANLIDHIGRAGLVVLDDVGAHARSPRADMWLEEALEARIARIPHGGVTIVSINAEPGQWADVIGERMASRFAKLAGGVRWVVPVTGRDMRLESAKCA